MAQPKDDCSIRCPWAKLWITDVYKYSYIYRPCQHKREASMRSLRLSTSDRDSDSNNSFPATPSPFPLVITPASSTAPHSSPSPPSSLIARTSRIESPGTLPPNARTRIIRIATAHVTIRRPAALVARAARKISARADAVESEVGVEGGVAGIGEAVGDAVERAVCWWGRWRGRVVEALFGAGGEGVLEGCQLGLGFVGEGRMDFGYRVGCCAGEEEGWQEA